MTKSQKLILLAQELKLLDPAILTCCWSDRSKLEAFVEFILANGTPTNVPGKPYVGKVIKLKNYKKISVKPPKKYAGPKYVYRNVLPEAVLIIDENQHYMCVAGSDGMLYWIKRYYFSTQAAV